MDGSSNENGSGVGIILISQEGHRVHTTLRFRFEASNNDDEYEALLAELRVARELKAKAIQCDCDSQLVNNQALGEYEARGTKMEAYLAKVMGELFEFEYNTVEQIPREQNRNVDALARLATTKEAETLNVVPVEFLESPSVIEEIIEVKMIDTRPTCMTPIMEYLTTGKLPNDRKDAKKKYFIKLRGM